MPPHGVLRHPARRRRLLPVPIGVIAAQAVKAFRASDIIVSDPVADRRALAERFGATQTLDPARESASELAVDAFIDASGATPAIVGGIKAVHGGGVVVLVGMGADEIPMPIPVIQSRELIVTGVFRYADSWPLAAQLVASGQVDLDSLVTARFPLEDTEKALTTDTALGNLKTVVLL